MTADVVQGANVRVREGGHRPRFTAEPGVYLLIACGTSGENFDCDATLQTSVGGAEDLPHPAASEKTFDPVRAKCGTWIEIGIIIEQDCRGRPDRSIEDV
jgi:hypothetical protein